MPHPMLWVKLVLLLQCHYSRLLRTRFHVIECKITVESSQVARIHAVSASSFSDQAAQVWHSAWRSSLSLKMTLGITNTRRLRGVSGFLLCWKMNGVSHAHMLGVCCCTHSGSALFFSLSDSEESCCSVCEGWPLLKLVSTWHEDPSWQRRSAVSLTLGAWCNTSHTPPSPMLIYF